MRLILPGELATLLRDFAMTISRTLCRSSLALRFVIAAQASASAQASREAKFVGRGSWSASACHGGVAPAKASGRLQHELSGWVLRDKHNQDYTALQTPVA